jgi:hypothetical protein
VFDAFVELVEFVEFVEFVELVELVAKFQIAYHTPAHPVVHFV